MLVPLTVIGAILLFLALLLALRIRIIITYRDEVRLFVRILCFQFRLYPRKKKVKWRRYSKKGRSRTEKKRLKKLEKHKSKHPAKPAQKQPLGERITVIRALLAAVFRKTGKHLRLHAVRLHVRVATGDAASTAVLYGAVAQSLGYLFALLDRITRVKATTESVNVVADYLSSKPSADVKLVLSIRVFGAIALLLAAVSTYMRSKKAQKARLATKSKPETQPLECGTK